MVLHHGEEKVSLNRRENPPTPLSISGRGTQGTLAFVLCHLPAAEDGPVPGARAGCPAVGKTIAVQAFVLPCSPRRD